MKNLRNVATFDLNISTTSTLFAENITCVLILIVVTFTSSKSWIHLRKQFIVFSPVSTNDQGFVQHMELVWKRFFSLGISRWFWSWSSDIILIHKQFSSGCDFACFYYHKYSIVCSGRWPIVSFVQKSSKVSFNFFPLWWVLLLYFCGKELPFF